MSSVSGSDHVTKGYRQRLEEGRQAMAHLIHVWHERNGWSHKVLPALADALDLGRVHNSQISNLRNGKLSSPGPELFLALGQANAVLHQGVEPIHAHLAEVHPDLLRVLRDSAVPLLGVDGEPLGAGDFLEIFVGLGPLPPGFDWRIDAGEAAQLSAAMADSLCRGQAWRQCRDAVMEAYPVTKPQRRERFAEVMAGLREYSAEERDGEFLDLYATHLALEGNKGQTAEAFLGELRAAAQPG